MRTQGAGLSKSKNPVLAAVVDVIACFYWVLSPAS